MTKYFLSRQVTERVVKVGIITHYAIYTLYNDDQSANHLLQTLDVPCKSNLNYILTGLYFSFDWNAEDRVEIQEEDAMMLKHIFDSQTEYKLYKSAMKIISEKGTEEGRKWLIEQTKILALRNLLRGK